MANRGESMIKGFDQLLLFENNESHGQIAPTADDADVQFTKFFIASEEADHLFDVLKDLEGWRQDRIRIFGQVRPLPRLHRWFADSSQPHHWSGIVMHPEPFPEVLQVILDLLWKKGGVRFNSALGNFYRSGRDSVAWHSDDEAALGPEPVIASLSLGATRRFLLRKKNDHKLVKSFELTHGSLLWMSGSTQALWEHSIPKTTRTIGPRINLTFRAIGG
jgi:alkylated DNA repair dioxygenase AlkB